MRIQSLNHSAYQHQYHIVWGTKYRRKILKPYVIQELDKSLYHTINDYPELYLHAHKTDDDHIHLQLEIAPSISVAAAVKALKARSSIHLKKHFKFIREMYLDSGVWSVGYFSSTIGLNEEQIKRYIEYQGRRDFPNQARFEFS